MFWRFGLASSSTIDSLLEKEDVTLEDVLNDADVLQESKANNEKLVEFFQRPGIVPVSYTHLTLPTILLV